MSAPQSVQCFGKKKTATAVALCKQGKGLIKVNGKPLSLVQPQILRFKVYEPVLILGADKFGTCCCYRSLAGLEKLEAEGGGGIQDAHLRCQRAVGCEEEYGANTSSQPMSTSESESVAVVTLPRSTPSVKPFRRAS